MAQNSPVGPAHPNLAREVNHLCRVLNIAILAWAAICLATVASAQPPAKLNVVVIVIDAARADHIGCYGYARETSPVVDGLAARSVLLENALSQCGWTKPSIASLFTGTYPIQHRVFLGSTKDRQDRITSDILPTDFTTLAEAFRAGGYATAAFVENVQIRSFMGFDQGFDLYAEDLGEASRITAAFGDWLQKNSGKPFLAYMHYLDPHWPYTPPAPYNTFFALPASGTLDFNAVNWKYLERQIAAKEVTLSAQDLERMRALYDGEIRYVDASIGEVCNALRARGLFENTLIVVTADHGEEFMERGMVGHGSSLYDELLRVPLILRIPSAAPARIAQTVQLVDVMPTLLDYAGLPAVPEIGGVSLRPLIEGKEQVARAAFADYREEGESGIMQQSVRLERYKLIRTMAEQRADTTGSGSADAEEMPEITPGQWLEIDGVLQSPGRFLALELQPIETLDQARITALVEEADPATGALRLMGLSCRLLPTAKFKDDADRTVQPFALETGMWVQLRGQMTADGALEATRIKRIAADGNPEAEIKARVDEVRTEASGLVLRMLGLDVIVDDDSDFEGTWPALPADRAPAAVPPTLAPVASRTVIAVELYDLENDPGEKNNIAGREPQIVRDLIDRLDEWERDFGADSHASEQVPLSPAEIERLRSLGYVE